MKTFTKGKFEISQFQAAHCARKNAISPKVFNRSSKTFLLLKDVENRYLDKKFSGRSYFSFAMVRWNFPLHQRYSAETFHTERRGKNLKFPNSKLHTVPEKMLYHQRYSTDLQKLFFCWKMRKIGIWTKNFSGRSYFSFAMVRWKLFSKGKIRNFPLSSCTLCQKKCYITKGIQPIFKNFPSAERCGK